MEFGVTNAWFKGGRYDAPVIGVVVNTKKLVQIEVEKATRPEISAGQAHWAPADRIVVLGSDQG